MAILRSSSPGYYTYSKEILTDTPTPHSSDYTVNEDDYMTPNVAPTKARNHLGPKSVNSFFFEIWILTRRNYKNIHRTLELFLSRLMVLTIMGFMMATMFMNPKRYLQGLPTAWVSSSSLSASSFFLQMTMSQLSFKSSLFLSARLHIIPTEPLHIPYLVSLLTSFFLLFRIVYAGIVWFALKLCWSILYFLIVLYASLLSTNSSVAFVSSVVPNFILVYAAVIAFNALFFLYCGYFLNSHDIPLYWKWMNKISPMIYPYEGLLMNQYQTLESFGTNCIGLNVTGLDILSQLSIYNKHESKKWEKVLIMLGWAVLYRIFFYLIIRFASKNQRT